MTMALQEKQVFAKEKNKTVHFHRIIQAWKWIL
jgi:hypothetical protein